MITIDDARLGPLLDGFAGRRVAVFGDLMLDRYVWGEVERISPEAPVPVVWVKKESTRFGGAANVAENVASLGARASIVGCVGDDAAGEELLSLLGGRGVDTSGAVRVPGRPTTTKTRIIAQQQQIVRADREVAEAFDEATASAVAERLAAAVDACEALIVSDYGKGVVTEDAVRAAIARARESGRVVCVDPKESHFPSYRGVTAITPNQKEAGGAVGEKIEDEVTLERVGWALQRDLDADCVVITRGEHGMALFLRGGELVRLPTVAREVYDVTGAGDTVVSALGVALAAGATMVEAALIANHAAGIVIREVGTASVSTEEIARSFAAATGGS